MPAIRRDALLLRILKDLQDVRSALRRVTVNLPLFDIANENTPVQLTAKQDNYVIGNYDILRLSSSQPVIITGFRGGLKGRRLQLFNVGNYNIVLAHQSFDSDPENRFKFKNSTAFLAPGDTIQVYYDQTQERWIEATQVFQFTISGWQTYSMPVATFYDVAWSPEEEILAAVGTAAVATSPDGETWTSRTNPRATAIWQGVAWSSSLGLFCAVSAETTAGSAGNKIMTSNDGITWNMQTSPEVADADPWYGICWADDLSLFVAVGRDGAGAFDAATSPDGINWTLQSLSAALRTWNDVIWADNLSLLVATNTSSLNPMGASSTNGIAWTTRNYPTGVNLGDKNLSYSSILNRVVSVGRQGGNGYLFYSDNGTSWTATQSDDDTGKLWVSSAWSDSFRIFLVVDSAGNYAIQSNDGITYEDAEAASIGINSLIFVEELGRFIGVGVNQAAVVP